MTSDLNIQAFQYVLGELSRAETLAFEGRLETDQSAREALADAVLLTAALRQTPPIAVQAPPVQVGRRSRLVAISACAAACLMFVVVMRIPGVVRPERTVDESTIVGTWNELAGDEDLLSEFDSEVRRDDVHPEIPDWMVAAVLEETEALPREEGTL